MKLNERKSKGPDNISATLLRTLDLEPSPALTVLFQATLHCCEIHDDWRRAKVTQIYKKWIEHWHKITALSHLHLFFAKQPNMSSLDKYTNT